MKAMKHQSNLLGEIHQNSTIKTICKKAEKYHVHPQQTQFNKVDFDFIQGPKV